MYNNIGGKIKGLSIAFAVIGIIVAVLFGLIRLFNMDDFEDFIKSIVMTLVGCVASWISSWLFYGLGELIEDTHSIAVSNLNIRKIMEDMKRSSQENGNNNNVNTPQTQMNSNANRQAELYQLYSKGVITAEEYQKALASGEKA